MRDYVSIASAPYDEPCVMVTDKEPYLDAMKAECRRFLELIRKKLGEEPPGASLALKSNPHDFGTYYDVVCYYDDEDEDGAAYAFRCESDAPRTWDDDHLSPLEVARERTRQAIRQGLCQQCGEHIEDPELLTEHMRDHVRSHQASQAKNQATQEQRTMNCAICLKELKAGLKMKAVVRIPLNLGEHKNVVPYPGEPHEVEVVSKCRGTRDLWQVALLEPLGTAPKGYRFYIMPSCDLITEQPSPGRCHACKRTIALCMCQRVE